MKLPRRNFLHLVAGAAALPVMSCIAWAQAYPTRPVRIMVGFAAGGNEDDHANRPYRIALRPRDARDRRQQGSAGGQMQKISAGKFHSIPL